MDKKRNEKQVLTKPETQFSNSVHHSSGITHLVMLLGDGQRESGVEMGAVAVSPSFRLKMMHCCFDRTRRRIRSEGERKVKIARVLHHGGRRDGNSTVTLQQTQCSFESKIRSGKYNAFLDYEVCENHCTKYPLHVPRRWKMNISGKDSHTP